MTRRPEGIVHIVTWFDAGGAQETAAQLASGLCRRGWEVALLGGAPPADESPSVDDARRSGVRVVVLPWLRRAILPGSDLMALARLTIELRRTRPMVVHTHSSKAGLLGRLAATFARVPVKVHTVHGWSFDQDLSAPAARLAVLLERSAAVVTNAIVVVTDVDRSRGVRAGIAPRSRFRVIRSAVPLDRYGDVDPFERHRLRRSWGVDDDELVVGTVTRLAPPKDLATLLHAVARLCADRPDVKLVVAGDGPERAHSEDLIAALGLVDRVVMLGHRDDIAAILHTFDVFAFSSRREAMPRVLVEALAAGLPVVSADVGGIAEVVALAPVAVVVPPGDDAAFAWAIDRMFDAKEVSASGRKVALRGFDVEEMVSATDKLYRELIDG